MNVRLLAALALATVLAACGGGNKEQETGTAAAATTAVSAPIQPPTPATQAGITLTEVAENLPVTPGESFRLALMDVSCPQDQFGGCKEVAILGEIKVETKLALQDFKLRLNGYEVATTQFRKVGDVYYFAPTGYNTVQRSGSLEVMSVVSPSAPNGSATVTVTVATASVDTKLKMQTADLTVNVFALKQYAPAAIIPYPDGKGFAYNCPRDVAQGCQGSYSMTVWGTPGTVVTIVSSALYGGTYQTVIDGSGYVNFGAGVYAYPGGTDSVFVNVPGGSVSFSNFTSYSGGEQIAPVLPSGCTIVTPNNCKG